MTSPMGDKISVIIVTHNSLPVLSDCLGSLKAGFNGCRHEIINVDNGSADGSRATMQTYFPTAKIVAHQRNLGFGAACNAGAREASGDYLLFLNPDVIVDPDAIEQLIAAAESRKDAGVVVGRMRFPSGAFQATCRRLPGLGNMLLSRGSILSRFLRNGAAYTLPDFETISPVPVVSGTMMMIRRDVFDAAGGFDQRFFMFMEDVDLCLRLTRQGYTNYFVPFAGGVHLWGRGSNAGKFARNWHHHWAVWKYFRKHRPGLFTFVALPFALALNLLLVTLLPVSQPAGRR
ncbi:MAG TPA: glycosyltransferase family 2 protein [Candidatus Deferrimicrobium sp.]|nr:glycosyltransferase family 2 protein [Candidatus Deferrimicrobium sp.]